MAFFDTPEFKKLNAEWKKKLALSGFRDAEDDKGRLRPESMRKNREEVTAFIEWLADYVKNNTIKRTSHRKILELYVQGVPIKGYDGIVVRSGVASKSTVINVLNLYKFKWRQSLTNSNDYGSHKVCQGG